MKFHNPFIVFDLETTDEEPRCILEIGAVALSAKMEPLGSFQTLVKPVFEPSQRVLELIGRERAAFAAAPSFAEAASGFERFVTNLCGSIKKARLAAWGNYFDVNVLRGDYARNGLTFPFSGTCIDVKTVAILWHAMSGRRTDKLSVASTAKEMGVEISSPLHQALTDAQVTANILRCATQQMAEGVWIGKQYVEVRGS